MIRENLEKLQKWSFIVSIIGIVGLAIGIITILISVFSTKSFFMFIIMILVYILPVIIILKLFNASKKIKQALESSELDGNTLDEGISELGSYFKISGIVSIVFIVLSIIVLAVSGSFFINMLSNMSM